MAMADLIAKLESVDTDIRFMGLSDLIALYVGPDPPLWNPELVEHSVAMLGDPSADVRNQAVKAVAVLAQRADVVPFVLVVGAPAVVRAVALRSIFVSVPRQAKEHHDTLMRCLAESPIFRILEGTDALIEFIKAVDPAVLSPTEITQLVDYALELTVQPDLMRVHAFDILTLVAPHGSPELWMNKIQPLVRENIGNAQFLAFVAKVAPAVPSPAWLIPDVSDLVLAQTDNLDDIEVVKEALGALAAMYDLSPYFPREEAKALAKKLVAYYENELDGAADEGVDDATYGFSDDSDYFDESSRVRRAAAGLAVVTKDHAVVQSVAAAAIREPDEASQAAMFAALAQLPYTPSAELAGAVETAINKGCWSTAASGIRMFAENGDVTTAARLIRLATAQRPALIHQCIETLKVGDDTEVSEDLVEVVRTALGSDQPPTTPIHALRIAEQLQLKELAPLAFRFTEARHGEALRAAALRALTTLASPATWPDFIPAIGRVLSAEPGLREPALDALAAALASPGLSIDLARSIIFRIDEIIQVDPSPRDLAACAAALRSAPAATASEVVLAALKLPDSHQREAKERVLEVPPRFEQPDVIEWGVDNAALDLLRTASSPRALQVALTQSKDAAVHAAAAVNAMQLLGEHYKFGTTPYVDLPDSAIDVLLALAVQGTVWWEDWYSLSAVKTGVHSEKTAALLGALAAIAPDAGNSEIATLPGESLKKAAFIEYAKQRSEPTDVLRLAWEQEDLRVPEALAAALTRSSGREYTVFAEMFGNNDELIVATTKTAAPRLQSLALLEHVVLRKNAPVEVKTDACATLRWVLQTGPTEEVRTAPAVGAALAAVTPALEPSPGEVQTISIGPFKHTVDNGLPLRQTAMEAIYSCVGLSDGIDYEAVVQMIVTHSLKDAHDVKMLAYAVLSQLLEVAPMTIARFEVPILEAMDKELAVKLKENAVKQDIDRHTELLHVVADVRRKLTSLA